MVAAAELADHVGEQRSEDGETVAHALGAAEEADTAQEGAEPDDPSSRRPSQAEGEPNR